MLRDQLNYSDVMGHVTWVTILVYIPGWRKDCFARMWNFSMGQVAKEAYEFWWDGISKIRNRERYGKKSRQPTGHILRV